MIVAGYIRVSTQEQKLKGLSLESQECDIREYCQAHGYTLAKLYTDKGISARKNLYRRTAFVQLMHDVQDHKIDHIVVLRLDRFFRNVYDYHRMMHEYLEPNGCGWSAVKEQYDTTTTNGRLMINLRLAIAEQECDQDSDRIKDVFANRIRDGYAVYGSVPNGYKIEHKRFVPSEDADMIRDTFETYLRLSSVGKTMQYINAKYGRHDDYTYYARTLRKEIYTGKYRDNLNYCEPLISKELFDAVQRNHKINVRRRDTNNTYIYSGLIICADCGHRMIGLVNRGYTYYRCNHAYQDKRCTNNCYVRQDAIENYLLNNVERLLAEYIVSVQSREKNIAPRQKNKEQIQKKIERLTDLFVNGLIDMDELKRRKAELVNQIVAEEPRKIDLSAVTAFLNSGFRTIYGDLSAEEKQSLWRSIISDITIRDKEIVSVSFLSY